MLAVNDKHIRIDGKEARLAPELYRVGVPNMPEESIELEHFRILASPWIGFAVERV